jgi:mannosyltransferase
VRRAAGSPHLVALAGIVVFGAALRFATLDLQSYRYDEAVTVGRVLHPSLFDTLSTVPHSESTPPLYYALAWLWSRLFGTGEVGLRSLSALAGSASIVVIYLVATALGMRRRVGLIAAAMVAVSPVMIWFSQDARAYSLAFLLTALSLLFFARALRDPRRGTLLAWAFSSALALGTHYFTGFVVIPEAVLLLLWTNERRRVAASLLVILAAGGLLLPIALQQAENSHASWIAEQPLPERLERAGAKLVGSDNGDEHGVRQTDPIPLGVPAALALAALLMLALLADPSERRSARVAVLVGISGVLAPLALGVFGADYLDGRNLLPVFAPLTLVVAAGFGVRRAAPAGILAAAVLCFCSLVFTIEIDRLPRLQREDLRNAANQIGLPRPGVAIVTIRYATSQPLLYYLGADVATGRLPPLREIDLVGSKLAANRSARRLLPPRFRRIGSQPVSYNFTLTRFRAPYPVRVPLRLLQNGELVGGGRYSSVLTWPGAAAGRAAAR